jgi:hypothetical protein
MNPKTLGIRFFPIVAFTVNCRPAQIRPADADREDSRISMNATCRLAGAVRPSTLAVPDNAPAPGQS